MPDHPVFTEPAVTEEQQDTELGIGIRVQAINLAFQMYHTIYPAVFEGPTPKRDGAEIEIMAMAHHIEDFLMGKST